jgi:hypothetical protein
MQAGYNAEFLPEHYFTPRDGVFTPRDLTEMRQAFALALTDHENQVVDGEKEILGRLIVRLYRMGLIEPARLASAASFLLSSRLFRIATA